MLVTFVTIPYDITLHLLAKFKERNKKTKLKREREILKY